MSGLNDFRVDLKGRKFIPLMVGGMGTNISTAELVLAIEKLGGIAHLSDAMIPAVVDRELGTNYTSCRSKRLAAQKDQTDKSADQFDLEALAEATKKYISSVMEKASGKGLVLLNCMEKLTMNDSLATLKVRLNSALDAGIDGLTLSAGLHLSSFRLISENPRFKDALLGVVVSSTRALNLFLKRTSSVGRLPDYIVVEGPLAGGHLGFGEDWKNFSLEQISKDVKEMLQKARINIPVFAAGGIFTGQQAHDLIEHGAADGVQVATKFTVTKESGLPDEAKQAYFNAEPEDVVVNHLSPTGYLMRMLKSSPAIVLENKPNCEAYGYLLNHGSCPYLAQWNERKAGGSLEKTKCCLCTQMRNYKVWTCGTTVSRLKEISSKDENGKWRIPSAEEVWNSYCFG